jgi:prepilin-type N-terminal cleavage/methylation domain-containing protein
MMKRQLQKGFTLIEMLVVAPIVILAIGAFLTVIISMTGEVISSRASNALVYNIQDALNRVEQDTKLSTGFLAQTDTDPAGAGGNALEAGQGINNTTAPFLSVSGGTSSLILNMIATNDNPLSPNSSFVFLINQPDPCASPQANQPLSYNVVYFVQDSTLWRRVVMPQNYADTTNFSCATPWQRPSCNPAFIANPGNAFCATEDIRLVDGVTDFITQYLNGASGETVVTAAMLEGANDAAAIAARNIAMQTATTLSVSIASTQTAAGREVSQASSLRVSRLDTNASAIATLPASTIPSAPTVGGTTAPGARAVFTWPSVDGATGYTFEFNINGGSWQTGFTNQNTRTFTVSASANQDVVNSRVFAINSAGTSVQALSTVTIPLWEPLVLENSWSNFELGYSRASYSKTSQGVVVVKGMIQRTGAITIGETIGNLPVGFRPTNNLLFGSIANNLTARVDVTSTGNILANAGTSVTWTSLETIRFVASGAQSFTAASFLNGWSNSAGWQTNGTAQDGLSRVWTQGVAAPGTNTDGTPIFSLPAGRQPAQTQIIASRSSTFSGYLVSNTVATRGLGTTLLSTNGMFYPSGAGTWTNMTLQNSWVFFGAPFSTAQYIKATDGIVSLKGLVRSGTATAGTAITTLPVGFRPKERITYTTIANMAIARVDIQTNGVVSIQLGSNSWFSLDGVHFIGEQ